MRIQWMILAISLTLSISGCKKVCENVEVGTVDLSAIAKSFLNYEEGEQVTFVSENGEEITFTASRLDEEYFICQKVTCDPIDPYKSSYCEYLSSPQISIFLNTDSTLIGLTAALQTYEPESDLIYEYIKFTISHVNDSATASYISDVRFTSPEFEKDQINDIDHYVVERSSIQLNQKVYTDVLVCEDEKLTLVYEEGVGFAGFKINNTTYTAK